MKIIGWAAWPLIAPAKKFSLSNPNSLMYASSVVCEDPELSNLNHTVTGTRLWYSNSITWNGMFTSMANIVYPANSHSISKWKDRDILQRCEIKIFSFSGSITFSFVVDEWDMVTGGQITSLTAQSGVLAATQGESASQYFDQYESRIPMSDKSSWKNITRAMSIGFETVFNGTEYNSTQGASFCNLMQWATLPDGLYYTNITWKGVAAAIGSISHYVAMQYESNAVATCSYYALGSAGFMSVNEDARTATYVLSGTLASLALFYVIWWYFTNIDGWTVDKVGYILY